MQSKCGLKRQVVDQVVPYLQGIGADLNVLFYMTLNFHWNMQDPRFLFLHKFLDEQYNELLEEIDAIAERFRKLGRDAPASMREFLKEAELKEPSGNYTGNEMITLLAESHEHMIKKIRQAVTDTGNLGDPGTADMLTGQLRWHEKQAWMLRSHLE